MVKLIGVNCVKKVIILISLIYILGIRVRLMLNFKEEKYIVNFRNVFWCLFFKVYV